MDEGLHSGATVQLYLRARSEPIAIVRINKSQFSVRVYTQSGEFFDFAYSAIEGAKYKRLPTMDLSGV
ncbi:hypothetical protein CA233_07235 [Sphingomonas sp. ABOLD]|nr:hypothetical protein CA234_13555 [Sphingomonas sp. ABOLE]RSV50196.1 hypothetical protein CA233_07235 [Sphingomonas sp. ABOLD]